MLSAIIIKTIISINMVVNIIYTVTKEMQRVEK